MSRKRSRRGAGLPGMNTLANIKWQVRRSKYRAWLLLNVGAEGEPRAFGLAVTSYRFRLNSWICVRWGHRMRPVGAPSTRRICHRCWMHQDGPESPYDRRQRWLWQQRLAEIIEREEAR